MTVRGAVRKGLTHLRDFQVGVLLAEEPAGGDELIERPNCSLLALEPSLTTNVDTFVRQTTSISPRRAGNTSDAPSSRVRPSRSNTIRKNVMLLLQVSIPTADRH